MPFGYILSLRASVVLTACLVDADYSVDHTKNAHHLRGPRRVREAEEDCQLQISQVADDDQAQVIKFLLKVGPFLLGSVALTHLLLFLQQDPIGAEIVQQID